MNGADTAGATSPRLPARHDAYVAFATAWAGWRHRQGKWAIGPFQEAEEYLAVLDSSPEAAAALVAYLAPASGVPNAGYADDDAPCWCGSDHRTKDHDRDDRVSVTETGAPDLHEHTPCCSRVEWLEAALTVESMARALAIANEKNHTPEGAADHWPQYADEAQRVLTALAVSR